MAKERAVKSASMNPDDFAEGGGLLDNVNVTWKDCKFVMWDYMGKVAQAGPAFQVTMDVEDASEEADQYWSCGNAKDWEPSEDGEELIPIGSATGINKSSNFAILIASLIGAGFPKDKIGTKASVFNGMECHMARVAAPKRAGLTPAAPREDGRTFEKTILIVDKITKVPGGKSAAKGTTKGAETSDGVDEKATNAVMAILEANPKGLDKKKLVQQVYGKLKTDPDRNAVLALVQTDEFLNEGGPWEYEKGIVKM